MGTYPVKKIFVVDVMAMAFRTFHAFAQRPLSTAEGLPTSAIFGSAMYLLKLLTEEKPDYLVVVSDSKEKNFRHDLFAGYKAHRQEMPEDLATQIPYLFELFAHMRIPLLIQPGYEADDLIGSLVSSYGDEQHHCFIVSGDKDFYQLVNAHTFVFSPKKGGTNLLVDNQAVYERFHCHPHQVIDILALWGDGADNVPGVPGIGEKSAIKLIEQHGSIEQLLLKVEAIANPRVREALSSHRDQLLLARNLVTIKTDIPITITREAMAVDLAAVMTSKELYEFFKKLEFSSLCERLDKFRHLSRDSDEDETPSSLKTTAVPRMLIPSQSESAPGKYHLLNRRATISAFVARALAAPVMAFDSETTGLDVAGDRPIGLSFALEPGEAYYVPLLAQHLDGISPAEVTNLIAPLFKKTTLCKVAHNLKFDAQMLGNIGLAVEGASGDTMLAAFCCDATEASFSLDELSAKYLHLTKIAITALIGKKRDIPMSEVPLAQLVSYACEDADCCLRLYQHFLPQLIALGLEPLYREVELPLVPILADMEKTGIYVDVPWFITISQRLSKRRERLAQEIFGLAGEEFNISSPKQLQVILFEKLAIPELLGIKRLKKNKNGYSTDVSVLEALAAHPLPQKILDYRSVSKLQNTYVDVLPKLVNPRTGRIHTNFHQTGTSTGRLSSSHPNLQNIPIQSEDGREIRRAFCARPGCLIVSADYSQVELRILAHIAEDETLSKAFHADHDIHTETAAQLLQKAPDQVTHLERSQAKAINYGIVYGMGPQRLAQEIAVSIPEAKKFIAAYFAHFPRIEHYIEQAVAFAQRHGYSQTILGRRRKITGLDGSLGSLAQVNARNIAINAPIQGSAADIIKIAMREIYRDLATHHLHAKMLLQVHDELVFECPEAEWELLREIVVKRMEHAYPLSVPLKVNIGAGKNWLEAH